MLVLLAIVVGIISIYLAWRDAQKDKKLDEEMARIREDIAKRQS